MRWPTTPCRVLVVFAHPVADSFIGAARGRAVAALEAAGHTVDTIDLYAEEFDPVLQASEWANHDGHGGIPEDIRAHVTKLQWADSLVLVYPTWFGAQPSILKGWFDRVWVEGVAYRLPGNGGHLRPKLRNIRRIVVVTSHGSTRFINRTTGEPGKRVVRLGLRSLCHPLTRTQWIAFYGNDTAQPADRAAFLDRVEAQFGARLGLRLRGRIRARIRAR